MASNTSTKQKAKQIAISATIAASITASLFAVEQLANPAEAKADTVSGCQDDFWFVPFRATRRIICDGVLRPDGSWLRAREMYTPAHQVPLTTNCYGYRYISCTTSGGYFQERTSMGVETYIVFPENRLQDEPEHLVNGAY